MDRRHQAVDDADLVVQHLGQRGEAVGRARGIRDDLVLRAELVVVDAVHKGAVDVLVARRRDDHLLRAAGDVRAGLGLAREETGRFEHDIDAEVAPGQLAGIALGEHLDAVAVDDDVATVDPDFTRETTVRGVVLRQVRVGLRIAEVVDGHDLDLVVAPGLVQRAQYVATDTAIAVDGDLD